MRALLLLLLPPSWIPGWVFFGVAIACQRLLGGMVDLGYVQVFTMVLVLGIIPSSAWFSGFLISKITNTTDTNFARFTALLALSYGFASGDVLHLCEAAFKLADPTRTLASSLLLWGDVINRGVFCAALPAFTIAALILAVELPYRWVTENWRGGSAIPLEGLRPVVPLVLLPLIIQYLISLYDAELGVSSLLILLGK